MKTNLATENEPIRNAYEIALARKRELASKAQAAEDALTRAIVRNEKAQVAYNEAARVVARLNCIGR